MTEFPLPDDGQFYSSGRGASSITRGPDGALWFTEVFARKIGRITTAGMIGEYFLENSASSPRKIVAGPDDALWFTEFLNQNGRIGRITIDGTISEYELSPCQGTCGRYPNGIIAGPDGALWFTDLGDDRIHSITTAGIVTDYGLIAVGNEGYAPGAITAGPDGALWFTASGGTDALGRITTNGEMTLFPLPLYSRPTYNGYNNLEPVSIATGPDGALWFTAGRVNVFGRMTVAGNATLYRLPQDAVVVNDEAGRFSSITLGPDSALWIGSPRYVVRVSLQFDRTAPAISLKTKPRTLWPPNGSMVPVIVSGRVTDAESGVLTNSVTYTVTDEYGVVQPSGPVPLDALGNYSFIVYLLASRQGADKDGRHYYVQVKAKDNAGNWGATTRMVIVPHDWR
jgi:virginiamycin B lyase